MGWTGTHDGTAADILERLRDDTDTPNPDAAPEPARKRQTAA